LSEREITTLRYLLVGHANKVIARRLEISEATVKVYVKAILRKLRVSNRTQAAIWAFNNGVQVVADDVKELDDEMIFDDVQVAAE
jgi:two-component system, NarL family, nitrate/nitrite response regulator NarL